MNSGAVIGIVVLFLLWLANRILSGVGAKPRPIPVLAEDWIYVSAKERILNWEIGINRIVAASVTIEDDGTAHWWAFRPSGFTLDGGNVPSGKTSNLAPMEARRLAEERLSIYLKGA